MANTSTRQITRYEPPQIPEYLSGTHKLKTILDVPSDDDVKAIHAVIKAVTGTSQIPALNDPSLAMQLTQHLFNVQMAVYRSIYSFNPFQKDHIYVPPAFPSHIPIRLEAVVGPPSDEQIISAHNSVRDLDNLSRVPSMFDPDLSMRLSQHLFNVQIARHIEEANQGRFNLETSQPRSEGSGPQPVSGVSRAGPAVDLQRDILDEREDISPQPHANSQSVAPTAASEYASRISGAPKDANDLFHVLQNINSTLISVQQSLVQSTASKNPYAIMNRKGELPSKYGLPKLNNTTKPSSDGKTKYTCMYLCGIGGYPSDPQLAAYLQFYEIGKNLVEVRDGELTIAEGKKEEAEILLGKHLVDHPGSGWAVPP